MAGLVRRFHYTTIRILCSDVFNFLSKQGEIQPIDPFYGNGIHWQQRSYATAKQQ